MIRLQRRVEGERVLRGYFTIYDRDVGYFANELVASVAPYSEYKIYFAEWHQRPSANRGNSAIYRYFRHAVFPEYDQALELS